MRWQGEGVVERLCWINALTANAPNPVGEAFRPDVVINQIPYEHGIGSVLRVLDPPLELGCLRNKLFSAKNNEEQPGRIGRAGIAQGVGDVLSESAGAVLVAEPPPGAASTGAGTDSGHVRPFRDVRPTESRGTA